LKTYKTNHLDTSRIEFILQLRKCTKLSGANGRKISGMREQDGPLVVKELVEVHIAMSSLRLEVWRYIQLAPCFHTSPISN
jgi:hypothetical protein